MKSKKEIIEFEKTAPNKLFIGGVGLLALLSASCCVLPIGLSIVGLSSSWLTLVGPFVTYRLEILAVLALVLAWSWYRLIKTWNCAGRRSLTLSVFVPATLALGLAASSSIWETTVTRGMWTLWLETRS